MNAKRASTSVKTARLFDEMLVVMCQSGDRQAAERLYRRWHPRLLRAGRRYANDDGLAEQLAQDCWLAIWRGLGSLKDPARFAPWAFTILRRRGAELVKREIVEREKLERVEARQEGVDEPRQEDAVSLNQALASLPPDQRLAAHLHFVEGLTLAEIASVQNVPLGTAKTRLFHARRKLKAALSDNPQGEDT